MFLFVWITFLLLQKSLCFQPSTALSIEEQNSTRSYLEEVTGTWNPSGTPVAANLETKISVDTNFNHVECSNSGDCTSQLDSSSLASPKITWSPAVSLSIASKDVDSYSTISSRKSESKTDVMDHPTTADFYGTLNHNENELDFGVKDKGLYITPTVNYNTVKTTENLLDILNVTSFPQEISSVFTSVPSKDLEELTHSPTTSNNSLLEHLFKISSSDDSQSSFSPSSAMPATSAPKETAAQMDETGTKGVESSSTHLLFRSTRNIASTDDVGNTTDHTVLDAESASSIQPLKLLFTTTTDPDSGKVNLKTNDSVETIGSEEIFSLPHSPDTSKVEKSNDSISTDQSIISTSDSTIDHTSILEGEVPSGTGISMTPHSLKETHVDSLPENINEMQTSTLPSQTTDVISPSVYSLGDKLGTANATMEHTSLENHKSTEEVMNSTDITSSTISHHASDILKTNDGGQEGTIDNNLPQFDEISITKGTILPFEEKSSSTYFTTLPVTLDEMKHFPTTAETGGLQNTSEDHSTVQSINPTKREEETTVSSVLATAETKPAVTSTMEPHPSDSIDLTSLSFNGRPTSQPPSSAVDPTTLSTTLEHSTFSSSTDFISPSTNGKVSPRILNQTLPNILDQVSSTTVSQSTHSNTTDEATASSSVFQSTHSNTTDETTASSSVFQSTPSSSVDQTSPSSVNQTSPTVVDLVASSAMDQPVSLSIATDQTTLTSIVGHPSASTVDQSTISGLRDQKSSSTLLESTSSSSVDLTTADSRSSASTSTVERNRTLITEVDAHTTVTPDSPSTMLPKTSAGIHVFPSMLLPSTVLNEETTSVTSKSELLDVTDSLSSTRSTSDYTSTPMSNVATETHREGKHIPFSTESTRRQTVESSNEVIFLTSTKQSEVETTTINLKEMIYNQLYYEDLKLNDKSNVITAVVQLPSQNVDNVDINMKIAEVHNFLEHILMKEFQNWTRDPFDVNGDQSGDMPFGKVTIFYISPTPKTKSSNITMTFIVHNEWRNETLPVDFVISILNFHSADLRQSMNVSAVHFYHGLLMDDSDLLPVILEKYGMIVFTTALAVIGSALLICIVIVYRKRNRRSVHYLSNNKLQHNMQESVGIDLTPAVVILQDEKKILNGNSKISDDEGWLVPIHEVPLAEDTNMPKVQDTKL